jgi:hypothetical protein
MFEYFDLNRRTETGGSWSVLSAKGKPPAGLTPPDEGHHLSAFDQAVMYAGGVIGVLFSSAISQFKKGTAGGFQFTLPAILIAAVVALVIMPIIYEKLSVKPNTPFIVRFGLFVQHGVFWQVLFDGIGKAIS